MKCPAVWIPVGILMTVAMFSCPAAAKVPPPGVGTLIDFVGDRFESPEWRFVHRMPKSSKDNNEQMNSPMGFSANRRWMEGPERGQPDHMKVVPTPSGGLAGSKQALLLRTLNSGVPGRPSYNVQQDDLIVNCTPRLGTTIRISEMPNCLVRLYLPPPEKWENRSGPHFGFRAGCTTTVNEGSQSVFGSRTSTIAKPYWPGMWVHFRSETDRKHEHDSAFIKVRANRRGRDYAVMEVDQWGWWTLGMSFTPDGKVHYYARPGVSSLTEGDFLASEHPYGYRAERFRSFFFNVVNRNDGRTWSTPFIIDDPELHLLRPNRIMEIVARKKSRQGRTTTAQKRRRTSKGN